MKKLISLITLIALSVGIFALSGCYTVESGTKEDIAGTYKLVELKYDKVDLLTTKEIVNYLVISQDGKGILYYKDNAMEKGHCQEIAVEFLEGYNDSGEVSGYDSIEYTIYNKKYNHVMDKEKYHLGFHKGDNMLKGGTVEIHGDIINTKEKIVRFQKISDDSTKGTLEKELKAEVFVIPYVLAEFVNPFIAQIHYTEKGTGTCINTEYSYNIFDFDIENNKVDIYYQLKEDKAPMVEKDVPITIDLSKENPVITIKDIQYKKVECGFIERDITIKTIADNQEKDVECTYTFSCSFEKHLSELLDYYKSLNS